MSTLFYDNRYLLVLSIGVILVAGLSALINLPRLEDPRITHRNPVIITPFAGATAERVEAQVTRPLEEALSGFYEIKDIQSTSRAGISLIMVELADWVDKTNNEAIFSKIRSEIDQVSAGFAPQIGKPVLDDERKAAAYTLIVSLSASDPSVLNRLGALLADRFRNQVGTEWVQLFGAPGEEILIEVDEIALAATGLSLLDLKRLVEGSDTSSASGILQTPTQRITLELSGGFEDLQALNNIPISILPNNTGLKLGDIARIKKTQVDPPSQGAFFQGEPVLLVAARMQPTLRIDHWTQAALENLEVFKQAHGQDAQAQIAYKQLMYTDRKLGDLTNNLGGGMIIVMAVVLLFMGWRLALIVGFALPLSMAATLFSLGFFNEQIHQMTIFGMIIAIGLLIDNAIVVGNEVRINRFERGLSGREALINSVAHLKGPLLASSITTILGFMPIFLLKGNIGDFVGPIAIAVVMALIASYFISVMLIAPLAAYGGTSSDVSRKQDRWWCHGMKLPKLARRFEAFLRYCVVRPKLTVLVSMVLPISGFLLAGTLDRLFFPSADRDHFEVKVWLPTQTAYEQTRALTVEIDSFVRAQPCVARTSWLMGGPHPAVYYNQLSLQDNSPYYAHGVVYADSIAGANQLIRQLQSQLSERFLHARIVVRAFGQGPPTQAPIEFRIYGEDLGLLSEYAQTIRLAMSRQAGIVAHLQTISSGQPKLWFDMNEDAVRRVGLTPVELSAQIQAATQGVVAGRFFESTEALDVRLRLNRDQLNEISDLQDLSVSVIANAERTWVPLSALGTWRLEPTLDAITRRNGVRSVVVRGFISDAVTPLDVTEAIEADLNAQGFQVSNGYRLELGGDTDQSSQAVGQLTQYVPVLFMLLVSTLILTFRSIKLAMLVLTVAFLSAGLGMLSVWIAGFERGFNPMIGVAGLIGVAINDTIIVLAALRAHSKASLGDAKAVVEATLGTSRHVFSTTLTTVGGFLPLLLGGGNFWPPLAVVMAGGIFFATYLALIFTPTVYLVCVRRRAKAEARYL